MGKLRKIGRKVTRALRKVFGKKLGSLIGGIGLSMVMWGGAKVLFPGLTSAISQQVTNLKNNVFGTPTEAVVEVKEVLSDDVIAKAKQVDVTGGATGKVEGDITEFVDFTDGSNLVPKGGSKNFATAVTDPKKLTERGTTFTEEFVSGMNKIGEGIKNIPSNTAEFIADLPNKISEVPGDVYDYVVEGEFIPDTALSLIGSELFDEEQKQSFAQGPVADQATMVAAKENYIREVSPSAMTATGMTTPFNFENLAQQTLYGTGSPSWMAQFYQPLLTPQKLIG